ncbi:universal stress protein [Streptomyces sp. NPDC014777]|uniref:universal stress protein n=2 Tax=unclassified Streptomyces TaxID=2593676 RepID=UPI0036F510C3
MQVLDEALREAAERHRDVPVNREVVEGAARRALLDAAADTDLLVVGARWRHGHVGLQLDLVNHVVLHHAPCPIAIVPRT